MLALWSKLSVAGAYATMPVVATTFNMTFLLWVSLCPAQFLFYTAWESVIAKYPPVTFVCYFLGLLTTIL